MSYIPNIRNKYENGRFGLKKEGNIEVNSYWQGFLNDSGVNALRDYDMAMDAVESFFENLEVYNEDINDAIREYVEATGMPAAIAFTEKPLDDVVNVDVLNKETDMTEDDYRTVSLRTIFMRTVFECMMHWMNMHRNEFGVSLLDDMPEDEYNKIVDKVLSGERKNQYTEEDAEN